MIYAVFCEAALVRCGGGTCLLAPLLRTGPPARPAKAAAWAASFTAGLFGSAHVCRAVRFGLGVP